MVPATRVPERCEDEAEDGAVVPAVLDNHGPAVGAGTGVGSGPQDGTRGGWLGRECSPGLPGQQSDPLVVSFGAAEQLPAPESLDIGHMVSIPSASNQGLQSLDGGAGGCTDRRSLPHPVLPSCTHNLPGRPNLPEIGCWWDSPGDTGRESCVSAAGSGRGWAGTEPGPWAQGPHHCMLSLGPEWLPQPGEPSKNATETC